MMDNLYAVFCDGDFDQLCYSKREADFEKSDLTNMGFSVSVKKVPLEKAQSKGWV